MTELELQIFKQFLKSKYRRIFDEAIQHVKEFTDYIDSKTNAWIEEQYSMQNTPDLSQLSLGSLTEDETDDKIVQGWLSSPTPIPFSEVELRSFISK